MKKVSERVSEWERERERERDLAKVIEVVVSILSMKDIFSKGYSISISKLLFSSTFSKMYLKIRINLINII